MKGSKPRKEESGDAVMPCNLGKVCTVADSVENTQAYAEANSSEF